MSIASRIAAISSSSLTARSASTRAGHRDELDRRELLLERLVIGDAQRRRLEAEPAKPSLPTTSATPAIIDWPTGRMCDLQLGAFLLELGRVAAVGDDDRPIAGQEQRRESPVKPVR